LQPPPFSSPAKPMRKGYHRPADNIQVDTESDQAKDDVLALRLWDLSVKVLKDKADYDVRM
jgi:hypothetical protein